MERRQDEKRQDDETTPGEEVERGGEEMRREETRRDETRRDKMRRGGGEERRALRCHFKGKYQLVCQNLSRTQLSSKCTCQTQ